MTSSRGGPSVEGLTGRPNFRGTLRGRVGLSTRDVTEVTQIHYPRRLRSKNLGNCLVSPRIFPIMRDKGLVTTH